MPQVTYQPMINGTAYGWSQIVVNVLGVPVVGIKSIKYSEDQEMQDNYGAGNRPVSRGYGPIKATGSITLLMSEVEALQKVSSTGRLQDIPEFDIVVSYIPEGGEIVSHTIHNCRFMKNSREASQGDMEMTSELELLVSHISWK